MLKVSFKAPFGCRRTGLFFLVFTDCQVIHDPADCRRSDRFLCVKRIVVAAAIAGFIFRYLYRCVTSSVHQSISTVDV
jgi:hypothetical protein